ncbi:GCN5-related N-acetyltransferase [Colwellia sp. 20A7]|uniref:GCN5-related N-acetyltransferase n=1 Tax=Colwellia sp. 20A7 TaxID=2689569 RepID=UPI001915855F|nr:GCN5-related N-acetyltransferase [Colwellia sp. 20A7]
MISGYRISYDLKDMDIIAINRFIANSYCAKGISLETMKKAMNNSLSFGVFNNL